MVRPAPECKLCLADRLVQAAKLQDYPSCKSLRHSGLPALRATVWTFPTQGFPTSGETPDGHRSRPENHDPAQLTKRSPLPLSKFNLTKIDFWLKWSDLGASGDAWSTPTTWDCFCESQNKPCACITMCPMLVGDGLCKHDSIPSSSRLYPRASCMAYFRHLGLAR